MKRLAEIQINHFQLAILLDEQQKKGYDMIIDDNVYCAHCQDVCENGIVVDGIFLTPLNDVMVQGTCNVCKGKVARVMEFGEDIAFFEKSMKLRKALID